MEISWKYKDCDILLQISIPHFHGPFPLKTFALLEMVRAPRMLLTGKKAVFHHDDYHDLPQL